MIKLFSYGTLMDPIIQMDLTGRLWKGLPDKIEGWWIVERDLGAGIYTGLLIGDDLINGVVFDIYEDELSILDEYEGDSYQRISTKTIDNVETYLYIWK